jgi:hypothetical protein
VTRDATEAALLAAAAEAERRIATCHEVVGCPRCKAPVGERCRRMPRGWQRGAYVQIAQVVGPHRERWTRVVPAR